MTEAIQNKSNTEVSHEQALALLASGKGAEIKKDDFILCCKGCSTLQRNILYGMFIKPNILTAQQQGILLTIAAQERIMQAKKSLEEKVKLGSLSNEEAVILQSIDDGSFPSVAIDEIEKKYKQSTRPVQEVIIASLDRLKDGNPIWEIPKKQRLFFLAGEDQIIQTLTSKNNVAQTSASVPMGKKDIDLTQDELLEAGKKIMMYPFQQLLHCPLRELLAGEKLLQISIMKPGQFASFPFSQNEVGMIAEKLFYLKGKRDDFNPKGFLRGINARSKNTMNKLPFEQNEQSNGSTQSPT